MSDLTARRILIGVTGSIAAVRTVDLVRQLMRHGAEVRVVMTRPAAALVTPFLFENVTGREVVVDLFESREKVPHITLAEWAEILAVVPATAATLSRMATGLAEDPVSAMALAMEGRVLAAPAMNPRMWSHPATRRSVAQVEADGVTVVPPVWGEVVCGPQGEGRMAPVDEIILSIERLLCADAPLAGARVLVTAGPTRETIDAVRFISNPSTGAMGTALAREACRLGAEVRMIAGPGVPDPPRLIPTKRVASVEGMKAALAESFPWCTILVMAAAVGDYRPAVAVKGKRKKGAAWDLPLLPTEDLLAGVAARKENRLIVGFAAEVQDHEEEGGRKLRAKNMDMIVVNDVSRPDSGFRSPTNQATIIDRFGNVVRLPLLSKEDLAGMVFRHLLDHLAG